MFFKGKYLRVTTMETINGIIPKTVNDVVQYKETFAPFSAKKYYDQKIKRLTRNGHARLAPRIEIVDDSKHAVLPNGGDIKL